MITGKKMDKTVFAVMLLLFALVLNACSQGQADEVAVEETKVNDSDENSSVSDSGDESTESSADDSDNEIDPEKEWTRNVLSNDTGEIKVVVYNYESKKNISVKNGDKVPFSKEGDTLAFLIPGSNNISNSIMSSLFDSTDATFSSSDDGILSGQTRYFSNPICDEDSFLFQFSFDIGGTPMDYYITLDFREGADEKVKELGLDSILPGLEWIATLDDIITQPTVIIYNDKTNKKILVEDKDELYLSDPDDVVAYYSPNADLYPLSSEMSFNYEFEKSWVGSDELPDASDSPRKILCYQTKLVEESSDSDIEVMGCQDTFSFPVTFDSSGAPESYLEFYIYTPY